MINSQVIVFQILKVLSSPHDTNFDPSGENYKCMTESVWPSNFFLIDYPVEQSQNWIIFSTPAVAIILPFGENAIAINSFLDPSSGFL